MVPKLKYEHLFNLASFAKMRVGHSMPSVRNFHFNFYPNLVNHLRGHEI